MDYDIDSLNGAPMLTKYKYDNENANVSPKSYKNVNIHKLEWKYINVDKLQYECINVS